MANAALTLYGETLWISPYVLSSYVALREKGLPFEVVEVALVDGEQQQASYSDRSITARVPALAHGDFVLAESSAIAEYLEETFPAPRHPRLFPEPPRERARARQIMAWLRSDLGPLRDERPTVSIFMQPAETPLSAAGRESAAKLVRVAEQLLASNRRSLFDSWCLADSELALMLQRLVANGDPTPEPVREYAVAQWARPSVQEFVQHSRPRTVPESYWSIPGNVPPK
jgi:glutathione S-transferase